jgi:peptidoglycan hydrolase-like protein with peptidoglycan-binding domain
MPGIEDMIAEAIKTIGFSDKNNTVRTPIHTWYNEKFGNPDSGKYAWDWCDGAVTYWAWKSGNQAAVVFNTGYAYTVAHADAFKAKGQWHYGTSGIRRGDIVFFDWNGADSIAAIDHVGIVEKVEGSVVHTIEGNINSICGRFKRGAKEIAGYGRPAYSGASTGGGTVATTVKLADAIAKTDAATRVIQDALNKEYSGVVVDGDYGPQTTAAYTRWQKSLGWPGDGVPGRHSLWALAKKHDFKTDITGTPAGPGGAQVPTQPEPPTTPEVPVSTTVTFEDLGPGGDKAQNLIIQKLLAEHWALDYSSGPGVWGDLTKAAYSRWQRSLGFSGSPAQPGSDADGLPGVTSMSRFAAKYGLTLKRRSDSPQAPTPPTTQPKPPATGGIPAVTAYLTVP